VYNTPCVTFFSVHGFQESEMLRSLFEERKRCKVAISDHLQILKKFEHLKDQFQQQISDLNEKIKIEKIYLDHMFKSEDSLNTVILKIQHGGIYKKKLLFIQT
jgi:predicted  nucleic acid-binding Zn-ribbon protein